MKKCIALVAVLAIGFFICGCTNRQPAGSTAFKNEAVSSKSQIPASGGLSPSQSSSNVAAWPTKAWSVSSPGKQGMDAGKLSKADKRIQDHYPNVYSLLIVRHGYLVYEKYYNGMNKYNANPVYSVTKSVISALTGIAIQERLVQNVNQRITDFLPEYFTDVNDSQKKNITIANALTMTGGLHSIDNDYQSYFMSRDWMEYAVRQPLSAKPGSKFEYNTGLPHFLSVIITKTSGMNTKEFADKYLFSKIGITAANWEQDSKGYYGGGFGLYLTPRDMAKFGYLYLNKGKWDGKQIIPENWVSESLQKHVAVNKGVDYGYLFWLQPMRNPISGKNHFAYRADGAGGQKIIVIPDLDMVAVITADVRIASSLKDGGATEKIISDYVLPAVNR